MAAIKLLVVGSPYEGDRIRQAMAAAGGTAFGAEAHDELGPVVASVRPDAIVLAGGGTARDPLGTVRRLRAAAGAHTPIVFVGDGQETTAVERLVDAAFRRPADPGALVSRAIALSFGRAPAAAVALDSSRLRRVAASIDEALNAEMLSALRAVADWDDTTAPEVLPEGEGPPPAEVVDALWGDLLAAPASASTWGDGDSEDDVPAPRDPAREGDLADVDLPLLLGRLFGEGMTGRLVLERDGVEKAIYLEAGRPVFAASANADDRLIEMLARQGRVTAAQRESAATAAGDSGRKMGALLIELGVLGTGELLPAVRRHYEEILLSLFSWTSGSWRIEPGVMASPAQVRLLRHPAALVREGLRRYPLERLWERLGSRKNVFAVELRGAAPDIVAEMVSEAAEKRVPLLLDGVRPLDEVVRLAGLPEASVGELTYTLWAFSVLRPAVTGPAAADRFALRDRDIERDRILARHALALEGDYFEVLGVGRDASPEEVRRAYELQCRELTPAALGPELSRSLAAELAVILEVLEEALRIVGDEALRASYHGGLPPRAARAEPRARH
jgi:hypothetical protein